MCPLAYQFVLIHHRLDLSQSAPRPRRDKHDEVVLCHIQHLLAVQDRHTRTGFLHCHGDMLPAFRYGIEPLSVTLHAAYLETCAEMIFEYSTQIAHLPVVG